MLWRLVPLLVALPASLLPESLRDARVTQPLPLSAGTVLSGVVEILLSATLVILAWPPYFHRVAGEAHHTLGSMAMTSEVMPGNGVLMVLGFTTFLGFLFLSLTGLAALLLFCEGVLRVAAGGAGLVVGSAFVVWPWALAVKAHRAWLRHRPARDLPDRLLWERNGHALIIDAAARRPWEKDATIEVGGGVYRLVGYRFELTALRPHQYRFERAPVWWTVPPEAYEAPPRSEQVVLPPPS